MRSVGRSAIPSRPVKCPNSSPTHRVAEVKIHAPAARLDQAPEALRDIKGHQAQSEAAWRALQRARALELIHRADAPEARGHVGGALRELRERGVLGGGRERGVHLAQGVLEPLHGIAQA